MGTALAICCGTCVADTMVPASRPAGKLLTRLLVKARVTPVPQVVAIAQRSVAVCRTWRAR